MKQQTTTTLLFLLISIFQSAFSQGNVNYGLRIVDNENNPLQNIHVTAVETSTLEQTQGVTNANGELILHLKNGKEWAFTVDQIKRAFFTTAVPFSIVDMEDVYVYDLIAHKRKEQQNFTRTDDGFTIKKKSFSPTDPIPQNHCMLAATIVHPTTGKTLPNVTVRLVNLRDKIIHETISNNKGEATFIVPNKTDYDIDINDLKNFGSSDFGDEYLKNSLQLAFAPTVVNEKIINDTIHQNVTTQTLASSDRALVKLNVRGGKKNGINETVFLREYKTNKVYTTKTTSDGFAMFLVPIHTVYMVDFKYQQNADAVNLKYAKGITESEFQAYYSPNPKLEYPEEFIPTSENLILESYKNFLKKQFVKPKNKPFSLKITNINTINKKSKEALFKVTLAGSDDYGKGIRLPANVAFVLDKSGSMYGSNRSEALKKSLWDIGSSMKDGDYVTVVLFDNSAVTVQQSRKNHIGGFETIIENYNPGGGTNILAGLKKAVENINNNLDPKISNRIILLTDGYGVSQPQVVTEYVEEQNNNGIDFSSIGLGSNYNQWLLKLIAKYGNGTFNSVQNSTELTNTILKQVKQALNYTVKDLKIEIFHDEELIYSNLSGYPAEKKSNNSIGFNISKLPKTTNEIGFLKFKLNEPTAQIISKPLVLKVSYYDLFKKESIAYEEKIKLNWTEETNTEIKLDQEEKKLFGIAILNQSLKLMAEANDVKDRKTAKKVLKNGVKQIEQVFPSAKPREVNKLLKEVKKYIELFKQIEVNEDPKN